MPENLREPIISAFSSDVPQWNKRSETYFEVLFAFASANLHDNGVLVFAHAADSEVSRTIYNWAHTEEFYVAKDWFGMNDLDLQSPTNPSELLIFFSFIHCHSYLISFIYVFLILLFIFVEIRKFCIKVLVHNEFVLNVCTSKFQDMGYDLKRDVGSTTLSMRRTSR